MCYVRVSSSLYSHGGFPGDAGSKKTKTKLPAKAGDAIDTQRLFLGQEDALEEDMSAHCSIITWQATVHGAANSQT